MPASNLASTGSPQSFTDPQVFDAEIDKAFRKGWVCVAHVSQLRAPGDFVTADLFGAPIVVVRGKDDEIRALSNVCLHRAMPIASGTGNTHVLTCPYHLWAYDLDGQLKSMPLVGKDSGIDVSAYRLPCLKTEVWEGFVFATRNRDAEPLAAQLADLTKLVAPFKMAELEEVGALTYASPWNWKVLVENFMEAYHHIGPHRDTLQPANPALLSGRAAGEGPFSVLEMPPVDADHDPLWAMCIYPNMLFALVPNKDRTYLTWYQMTNMRGDHFDLTVHVYLDKARAAKADEAQGAVALTDMVHQEDIPMCDGVWRGLQSPYAIKGPLAPGLEAPLAHFRAWVDAQLAR